MKRIIVTKSGTTFTITIEGEDDDRKATNANQAYLKAVELKRRHGADCIEWR